MAFTSISTIAAAGEPQISSDDSGKEAIRKEEKEIRKYLGFFAEFSPLN
jgi:hypothetical protein